MSLPTCELFQEKCWGVHFTIGPKWFAHFWTRPGPSSGHRNPEIAESYTFTVSKWLFLIAPEIQFLLHLDQEKLLVRRFGRKMTPLGGRGGLNRDQELWELLRNRDFHVLHHRERWSRPWLFPRENSILREIAGRVQLSESFLKTCSKPKLIFHVFYSDTLTSSSS